MTPPPGNRERPSDFSHALPRFSLKNLLQLVTVMAALLGLIAGALSHNITAVSLLCLLLLTMPVWVPFLYLRLEDPPTQRAAVAKHRFAVRSNHNAGRLSLLAAVKRIFHR